MEQRNALSSAERAIAPDAGIFRDLHSAVLSSAEQSEILLRCLRCRRRGALITQNTQCNYEKGTRSAIIRPAPIPYWLLEFYASPSRPRRYCLVSRCCLERVRGGHQVDIPPCCRT